MHMCMYTCKCRERGSGRESELLQCCLPSPRPELCLKSPSGWRLLHHHLSAILGGALKEDC